LKASCDNSQSNFESFTSDGGLICLSNGDLETIYEFQHQLVDAIESGEDINDFRVWAGIPFDKHCAQKGGQILIQSVIAVEI
jgi:hypothetical protein